MVKDHTPNHAFVLLWYCVSLVHRLRYRDSDRYRRADHGVIAHADKTHHLDVCGGERSEQRAARAAAGQRAAPRERER